MDKLPVATPGLRAEARIERVGNQARAGRAIVDAVFVLWLRVAGAVRSVFNEWGRNLRRRECMSPNGTKLSGLRKVYTGM